MIVNKTLLIEFEVPDIESCSAAEVFVTEELERYFRKEMCVMNPAVKKITIGSGQYGVKNTVIT